VELNLLNDFFSQSLESKTTSEVAKGIVEPKGSIADPVVKISRPSAKIDGKIPAGRPLKIGLIDLGGRLPQRFLDDLAKKLNSRQSRFLFVSVVRIVDMGNYDLLHGYSDKHLFKLVEDHLRGTGPSHGIGVTHFPLLQHDAFNRHDQNRGIGVITYSDYKKYTPTNKDLEQYLSYLILCELYCIVGRTDFEHELREYCLFDLCRNKEDLRECLNNPQINEGTVKCKSLLIAAGFAEDDIAAGEAILGFVKRPKLLRLIPNLVSAWSGILIGLLGGQLILELPVHFLQVSSIAIGILLGMSLVYNYYKSQKSQ
jgi:hypothetical protein